MRGMGKAEVEVQIHPSATTSRIIGGHPAGEAPTLVVACFHAPSSTLRGVNDDATGVTGG
jgi:hypothetical protein